MFACIGGALALDRLHAVALGRDGDDTVANDAPASPSKIRGNCGDLPVWIDRHALLRREHADRIVGPNVRLEREDVCSPEPLDPNTMLPPQRPGHRILSQPLFVRLE